MPDIQDAWQDISTAPLTKIVLLWADNGSDYWSICFGGYSKKQRKWCFDDVWCTGEEFDNCPPARHWTPLPIQPQFWMPIPAPPRPPSNKSSWFRVLGNDCPGAPLTH